MTTAETVEIIASMMAGPVTTAEIIASRMAGPDHKRYVAIHEAGHAVVAAAHGIYGSIAVVPDTRFTARCYTGGFLYYGRSGATGGRIHVAGFVAECIINDDITDADEIVRIWRLKWGGPSDLDMVGMPRSWERRADAVRVAIAILQREQHLFDAIVAALIKDVALTAGQIEKMAEELLVHKAEKLIVDIPCTLRKPESRRTVACVLRRIKKHFPRDYSRLLSRVKLIRPLPQSKATNGTIGELLGKIRVPTISGIDELEPFHADYCSWDDICECTIEVLDDGRSDAIAHELGHACTRDIDVQRRNAPDSEWGSEAAADWYAHKWGFPPDRRIRAIGHHGGEPGGWIEIDGVRFLMTRNHVYRRIST